MTKRFVRLNGVRKSLAQWCRELQIDYQAAYSRLEAGKPPNQILSIIPLREKHGGYSRHLSTYRCWQAIKQRCFNPRQRDYKNYGGRGITMCARWMKGFEFFLKDMGPMPVGHSIERKDVNDDYRPGNCTWIPKTHQMCNLRQTVRIAFEGEILPLTHVAHRVGIPPTTLRNRLRSGMPFDLAIQKTHFRFGPKLPLTSYPNERFRE
jgi:hypothetical protein